MERITWNRTAHSSQFKAVRTSVLGAVPAGSSARNCLAHAVAGASLFCTQQAFSAANMASGWPLDQPRTLTDGRPNPSWVPSDMDVPIESGEEDQYVPRMIQAMEEMERRYQVPDFLLVVDGADPYERDQLPSAELLRMTREQMLERDLWLYQWADERKLPTVFITGGNYGYHSWEVYAGFRSTNAPD